MKENSIVDRNPKNQRNFYIYRYFKSEELEDLNDSEFAVLQEKFKVLSLRDSGALYSFQHGTNAEGIHGDEAVLGIYRRSIAASHFYFDCFQRYARIFSLCYRLGVKNLYDIGCGHQMQGFLAVNVPDITYTGIDPDLYRDYLEEFECEPEFVNGYFEKFTGSDRIKYIKEEYPCALDVKENNAAIALGVFINEKNMPGAALARDFERVVLSIPLQGKYRLEGISAREILEKDLDVWNRPFERMFHLWKESMPGFEFYQLGEGVVFGTKCPGDRKILETEYQVTGDTVYTTLMNKEWYHRIELGR